MGYRNYFHIVEKEKADQFLAMSHEEQVRATASEYEDEEDIQRLIKEDGIYPLGFFKWANAIEIDEIGKYFDGATSDTIHKEAIADLSNSDCEFCFVKPEALLTVAEHLRESSQEYYTKLMKSFDMTDEEIKENWKDYPEGRPDFKHIMLLHIRNLDEVLNTKLNKPYQICNSYNYDYVMFELVHQYKTIDWNKYQLIWCGH